MHGGRVMAQGTCDEIMAVPDSVTGQYMSGRKQIAIPKRHKPGQDWIEVVGASGHSLKNVSVKFTVALVPVAIARLPAPRNATPGPEVAPASVASGWSSIVSALAVFVIEYRSAEDSDLPAW